MVLKRVVEVTKCFTFDSCHNLPYHAGKCKNKHGHTYKLEVTIRGDMQRDMSKSDCGMIIDFGDLKEIVNARVIDKFDHCDLNTFIPNPTAEQMAWDIFNILSQEINRDNDRIMFVSKIRLYETPDSFCEVRNIE